ncbi:MAG: peptidoglycan DD-metalloendopeptidase family protein, partial [Rhodoferax sp.]
NPNLIEVGQVLRVVPPVSGDVVVKPVAKPSVTASTVVLPPSVAIAPALAASAVAKPVAADSDIKWIWPASGVVVAGFDEAKNKGLDIGGTAGEAVVAAADGRVVYVGAGLRGYGNLIILKHDNVYLTAYAHNQTLLVKEDQTVLKGQKIAEMGNSDADRVKLHFEVRRQGKPVDPVKYLPPR